MHIIWGVIFIIGINLTKADVQELQYNDRAYLPPVKSKLNNEYLPPSNNEEIEIKVLSECCPCQQPLMANNVKINDNHNNEYLPPSREEVGKPKHKDPIPKREKVGVNNEYLPPTNEQVQNKVNIQGSPNNHSRLEDNPIPVEVKTRVNNEYLPPFKPVANSKPPMQQSNKKQPQELSGTDYQHNKPKVIDDPLPVKVNYIQPLRIDFLDGEYQPISKGALFTGLFLNTSEIKLTTERLPQKTKPNRTAAARTTIADTSAGKDVNYELKTDNTFHSHKYHKKLDEDIILINYPDDNTQYKLFNYDDNTELSGSAPVMIFKPGDDISFIEDTSIIDDYEHMPASIKATRTTTLAPAALETYNIAEDEQLAELSEQHSDETERSFTSHGYSYEEHPQLKSTKDEATEQALKRKTNGCVTTIISSESQCVNARPPTPDVEDNLSKETPEKKSEVTEQHSIQNKENHSNSENESIHSNGGGGGYLYEKPKIPFTF